jgi:hypothetical protein
MDAVLPDPATPCGARVAHRLRATSPEEQLCYMHGGGCSLPAEATRARSSLADAPWVPPQTASPDTGPRGRRPRLTLVDGQ